MRALLKGLVPPLSGEMPSIDLKREVYTSPAPTRTARIEACSAPDALAIVKRAAEIEGAQRQRFRGSGSPEGYRAHERKPKSSVFWWKVIANCSIRRGRLPGSAKPPRRIAD